MTQADKSVGLAGSRRTDLNRILFHGCPLETGRYSKVGLGIEEAAKSNSSMVLVTVGTGGRPRMGVIISGRRSL